MKEELGEASCSNGGKEDDIGVEQLVVASLRRCFGEYGARSLGGGVEAPWVILQGGENKEVV